MVASSAIPKCAFLRRSPAPTSSWLVPFVEAGTMFSNEAEIRELLEAWDGLVVGVLRRLPLAVMSSSHQCAAAGAKLRTIDAVGRHQLRQPHFFCHRRG